MEAENQLLSMMYADETGIVYQAQSREIDSHLKRMCWLTDRTLYPDFHTCLDRCKTDSSAAAILGFMIEKQWIADGKKLTLLLSADGKPVKIEASWQPDHNEELSRVFGDMWFAFPTPFQKGDIVCSPDPYSADISMSEPFVLNCLCTGPECAEEFERTADSANMTAYGYFARRDGGIRYDCEHNYMDLVFYHGELTGGRRVLKGLSNYLKDKIDVGLLLNSNYLLRLQAQSAELTERPDYTQEGVELCGLGSEQAENSASS